MNDFSSFLPFRYLLLYWRAGHFLTSHSSVDKKFELPLVSNPPPIFPQKIVRTKEKKELLSSGRQANTSDVYWDWFHPLIYSTKKPHAAMGMFLFKRTKFMAMCLCSRLSSRLIILEMFSALYLGIAKQLVVSIFSLPWSVITCCTFTEVVPR